MRIKNRNLVQMIVAWVLVLLFLLLSSPAKLPLYFVIVPFVLLGVALYCTWLVLLGLLGRDRAHTYELKILGLAVTIASLACLGLQSIGELTVKDCLAVFGFTAIAYFYLIRNIIQPKKRD